ncbi:MAG: leucine-rich repeat domain-containing protein [Eubacteriales bacterium]|nr:leucine-rich repeat domain-containing protein [Eubacteriales bacterium]
MKRKNMICLALFCAMMSASSSVSGAAISYEQTESTASEAEAMSDAESSGDVESVAEAPEIEIEGDYYYEINTDHTAMITMYTGNDEVVVIPEELGGYPVTALGKNTFHGQMNMKEVTLPESVTTIDDYAFNYCTALTEITIPDSVTSMGANPFSHCESLTTINVSIDQPVFATIEDVLFQKEEKRLVCYPAGKDSDLYEIPQGIQSIGAYAFNDCKALTEIRIPDSVTEIGDYAFGECNGLKELTIPDTVTILGENPFARCESLTIDVSVDHPVFATIDGVLFDKTEKRLISYPYNKTDDFYEVPKGILEIGNLAFDNCSALTRITIPDGVIRIGECAFLNCVSLEKINIPAGVTDIGEFAFYSCERLTEITIPDSVISIGRFAFYSCDTLSEITIPEGVTSIGTGAFADCDALTGITLPESLTSIENGAFDSGNGDLVLTVVRNSVARDYAKANGIEYTYPDLNDWLNG